jgi:dTDP-4-amino-4,6-dideoxygalactose transaminase
MKVPFNIPHTELQSYLNVKDLIESPNLLTKKEYTKLCEEYFEKMYQGYKALMTPSCSKALEIIAITLDFKNGDEIIMPSYNFSAVGSVFALHGATPIFSDIDPETMNISVESIKNNITKNTKAILVMHYAGIGCEMDKIINICKKNNIVLIEDNAQGICCSINGKLLGSFGDFSTISFDSMKNISCNEGGVLLYKDKYYSKISNIYHFGTNREDFEKGIVKQYEWVSKGSKFYISEFNSAILYPLLLLSNIICLERRESWNYMFDLFYEDNHLKQLLPLNSRYKEHNGHIFYIKCKNYYERSRLIDFLKLKGIICMSHYTPMHTSIFVKQNFISDHKSKIIFTKNESEKILRLPIYTSITKKEIEFIKYTIKKFYI